MNNVELKPKIIFDIFAEINQVPRPSGHEEKMGAYLKDFAEKHRLGFKMDAAGNVLISAPATPGYENKKPVIIQAHQDMVPEKNPDVEMNFLTDPIKTKIKGEWMMAKGTTLGADDGVGIAMGLAAMIDPDVEHGPMECLFTTDEERGLTGAEAIERNFMHGDILINLDSEDEGELFVGCAGGIRTNAEFTYTPVEVPENYIFLELALKNGKGGHSGDDINKGLANANKVLFRFLYKANRKYGMYLCSFNGGGLHNAIPRDASAVIAVPMMNKEEIRVDFNNWAAGVKEEFKRTEPAMELVMQSTDPRPAIDSKTADNLINCIMAVCNGVFEMSRDIEGLVETSSNLASVKMGEGNTIKVTASQRSSADNGKEVMADTIRAALELGGAKVENLASYPGWAPNMDSEILKIAVDTYRSLFDKEPKVKAIHAGLECGLFKEKYPELDMISFGPTLRGVHSPEERLHIPAVDLCWRHLKAILKAIPEV